LFIGAARKFLTLAKNNYRRIAASGSINSLSKSSHELGPKLSDAITRTLGGKLSQEESIWIQKIEKRRAELLADSRAFLVTDYGAGAGDRKRTMEEAAVGVQFESTVSQYAKFSRNKLHATLLFNVIRAVRPQRCVELGTCVGISASYQAAALALNGTGRITTLEGAEKVAEVARESFATLGLDNVDVIVGPFSATLAEALNSSPPCDLLFNDGHHDGEAVINYFNIALPLIADEVIIFLDDIYWSESMTAGWNTLLKDPRVRISIDFGSMGMLVLGGSSRSVEHFKIRV
jgi:predicted O-methyltransferase YrrM